MMKGLIVFFLEIFLFVASVTVSGSVYVVAKKYLGMSFDFWFIGIILLCFFVFYCCLLLGALLLYRCFLLFLGAKEGVFDMEKTRREADKQQFRIVIDFFVVKLYSPIILLVPDVLRFFGTKMGKGVFITGQVLNPDLLEIGNNCTMGLDSLVTGHLNEKNVLYFKRIKIGNNCTVGTRAIVMPGVEMGDGSIVAAGAVVLKNTRILPGEIWGGVPAKKIKDRPRDC